MDSNAESIEAGSATSSWRGCADRSIWRKRCAVFSASSSLISETRTIMPSRASCSAMAAPIPMAAPVTSATFESVFAGIGLQLLYLMHAQERQHVPMFGSRAAREVRRQALPGGQLVEDGLLILPSVIEAAVTRASRRDNRRLDVRIALFLVRTTRMGYGACHCRPNLLGILPKRARRIIRRAGPPFGFAFRKFSVGELYVKCADDRIDLNDVAVPQERDRSAHSRFRSDMADAQTAG